MNLLQISPGIKFLVYYKKFSLLPFLNSFFPQKKKKRKRKKRKKKDGRKIFYTSQILAFVAKFIAKELQFDLLIEIFLLT